MATRYLIRIEGSTGRSLVETDACDALEHAWRNPAAHPATYGPADAVNYVKGGHYVCAVAAGQDTYDPNLAAAGLSHWFDAGVACPCKECRRDSPLADQVHRELAAIGALVCLYDVELIDAYDMPGPQVVARACNMRLVAEAAVGAQRDGWIERATRGLEVQSARAAAA